MQKDVKRGTRRLCSLVLSVILALTSVLPVFAKEAEQPAINTFALHEGDILQPGTKIALKDWQGVYNVLYFDYSEDPVDLSGDWDYDADQYAADHALDYAGYKQDFSIKKYSAEGADGLSNAGQLALMETEFAGWQILSLNAYNITGSTMDGFLCLMALPKNATSKVTCDTKLSVTGKNGASLDSLKGTGITLYGFSNATGLPLEKNEKGELIASPGDIVYAVSSPVESYVSKLTVLTGAKPLDSAFVKDLLRWEKGNYTGAHWRQAIWNTERVSDFSFLPPMTEVDAVTAFVVPHTNLTVKAEYEYTDDTHQVEYYSDKKEGTNHISIETIENIPVNKLIKLGTDSDGTKLQHDAKILLWGVGSDDGPYYHADGEMLRIKCDYNNFAVCEREDDYKINKEQDVPVKAYYKDNRMDLRCNFDSLVEANQGKDADVCFIVDPDSVKAGHSVTGIGFGSHYFSLRISDSQYDNSYNVQTLNNGDVTVTVDYMDSPEDLTLDLTGKQAAASYSNYDEFLCTYLGIAPFLEIDRTYALRAGDIRTMGWGTYDGYWITWPKMLDLNQDGLWDIRLAEGMLWDEYGIYFERLEGAKYCKDNSYTFKCNQAGYGSITIKLYDPCKVEYMDGGNKVYTQDWKIGASLDAAAKEAAPTKDGYTLKGWSTKEDGSVLFDFTAPVEGDLKLYAVWEENAKTDPGKEEKKEEKPVAVKDEVKDEATGNTFVVTSTGEKNEVALRSVVVKKGTVTVPDSIMIGGKAYQVTSIEKGALKNAGSMKTFDLGTNVTKLFKNAFKKCKKLKTIKIRNKKKVVALNKNMFGKFKGKITLKVPKNMVKKYKQYLKKKKLTKYFKVAKL